MQNITTNYNPRNYNSCKTLQQITIQKDKRNTNYTRNYNSCKILQAITIHENITHVKHYKKLQSTKL
jgi:hypothetical protein